MWLWWQEVRVVCCQCYGRLFVVRWFIIFVSQGRAAFDKNLDAGLFIFEWVQRWVGDRCTALSCW